MSISEQVKELREYGDKILFAPKVRDVFNQAADTIESLSAKLQAANMERSDVQDNITLKDAMETDVWMMVWAGEPDRPLNVQMTYSDMVIIRRLIELKDKENKP